MSSLGIIPIRYQSKRLPNKTFRLVGNKPLIDWTLDIVTQSDIDDFIVVTSCKTVREHCDKKHVKSVFRPVGLESDSASVLDTIMWLNESQLNNAFDIQMLLQITNPTRTIEDVNVSLEMFELGGVNSVASIVNVGEWNPVRMYYKCMGGRLQALHPSQQWGNTQQLSKTYLRDGSIYAWRTQALLKQYGRTLLPDLCMGYEIEPERSVRIDTEKDLRRAESVLTAGAV